MVVSLDCSAVDFDWAGLDSDWTRLGWVGRDWIGLDSNESGLDQVRASKRASSSWWGGNRMKNWGRGWRWQLETPGSAFSHRAGKLDAADAMLGRGGDKAVWLVFVVMRRKRAGQRQTVWGTVVERAKVCTGEAGGQAGLEMDFPLRTLPTATLSFLPVLLCLSACPGG